MKYLAAIRDLAAIALLIVLAALLWSARADLISMREGLAKTNSDLASTQQQLRLTLLDVSRFTQDATGVTAALRHTLKASETSDELVAANSAAATQQAAAALTSLQQLISHTDANLNAQCSPIAAGGNPSPFRLVPTCGLIPSISIAVNQDNEDIDAALAELAKDERKMQPILQNAATTSAAAAKLSQDPAIADAIKNLDATSASAAATAKHVDAATGDLAAAIHRETRPVSFSVKVAGWIVNNAAKAGSVLAGFVK